MVGLVAAQMVGGACSAAAKPRVHASKAVRYVQRGFRLSRPNRRRRLVVRCPGRLVPLGGGVTSFPPPSGDGEGVYPHSYERLGAQQAYHSSVVLFDPSPHSNQPRRVTMQVACIHKRKHVTPPHRTVYVGPGQTRTAVATCAGRRHLFGAASSAQTSWRAAATTSPSPGRSPTSPGASPRTDSASSAAS